MGKIQILTMIITLLFFISFNCDNATDGDNVIDSVSQITFIYAVYDNDSLTIPKQEINYLGSTYVYGVIFGNPIPGFEYIKLGDKSFSGSPYYKYYPGYLMFGMVSGGEEIVITSNLNPLNTELKTSFGTLSNTISLPDSVENLTLNVVDTLPLNQPLTISWNNGSADFYEVILDYSWNDSMTYDYVYIDTFITDNSITFPGTLFSHNGNIYFNSVTSINGPLPGAGVEGNMSGDGSGFLYYISPSAYFNYIVVGTGSSDRAERMSLTKAERQDRFRGKIESTILGSP